MSVRVTEHGRVTLGCVRIDLVRFREQVFTTGLVTHGRVILEWGSLNSGFSTSVKGEEGWSDMAGVVICRLGL